MPGDVALGMTAVPDADATVSGRQVRWPLVATCKLATPWSLRETSVGLRMFPTAVKVSRAARRNLDE